MLVWNPVAIDYSLGVDIYDPITDTIYTEKEANVCSGDIKSRLVNKPRKIGCWVMTTEEAREVLKLRNLIT